MAFSRFHTESRPMSRHRRTLPLTITAVFLAMVLILPACKVVIRTPEHGYVESLSGEYLCQPESVCSISVNDTDFDEVFQAYSTDDSVQFSHWRRKFRGDADNYLCGKNTAECALTTAGFEESALLLAVLNSDQEYILEPVFRRDVDAGGSVLSECLIPKVPRNSRDYAAWNNNCGFATIVRWVDEDRCSRGCTEAPAALGQTDPVSDFTGDLVWAVCPGPDSPMTTDGRTWRGQVQYACASEPGLVFSALGDPMLTTATLSEIQSRVFNNSCAFSGCHGGAAPAAGQNLSPGRSFANLVNVPSSQNSSFIRVIPGDADNSLLVRKLEGTAPFGSRMPLGRAPLGSSDIQLIRDWIDAGALDN